MTFDVFMMTLSDEQPLKIDDENTGSRQRVYDIDLKEIESPIHVDTK